MPDLYPVSLTATDDRGATAEVVFEVNVTDASASMFTVPYVSDGAYADDLRPCAFSSDAGNCAMERLPFLGAQSTSPSIDDVMSRVLVSHRWMGDALKEVLHELPPDVRLLARSLTAIVITSNIRPANYNPSTGAIYLDSRFFWRTPEEFAVVVKEADYRSNYGATLQFAIPYRFVRNNAALARYRAANAVGGERDLDDLLPHVGFLLYHELAHAADFVDGANAAELPADATPNRALGARIDGPGLPSLHSSPGGHLLQWSRPDSRIRSLAAAGSCQ